MKDRNSKIRNMILAAFFAALTAVGAFLKIPNIIPSLPPITLQVFFVILAGLLLGAKWGAISQMLYVLLGLLGLPIFAKGYGGPSYVLETSFGYLIGFIFAAFIVGLLSQRINDNKEKAKYIFIKYLLVSFVGILVVYLFGIPYLFLILNVYLKSIKSVWWVLYYGGILFVLGDVISAIIASLIVIRLKKMRLFQ